MAAKREVRDEGHEPRKERAKRADGDHGNEEGIREELRQDHRRDHAGARNQHGDDGHAFFVQPAERPGEIAGAG